MPDSANSNLKPTVLVVDDTPDNLSLMSELLKDLYRVKVADVYDALISRRVHKEGMPHAKAVSIIVEGKGAHFDPDIADAFMVLKEQFHEVAQRFVDTGADLQNKADSLKVLAG